MFCSLSRMDQGHATGGLQNDEEAMATEGSPLSPPAASAANVPLQPLGAGLSLIERIKLLKEVPINQTIISISFFPHLKTLSHNFHLILSLSSSSLPLPLC